MSTTSHLSPAMRTALSAIVVAEQAAKRGQYADHSRASQPTLAALVKRGMIVKTNRYRPTAAGIAANEGSEV